MMKPRKRSWRYSSRKWLKAQIKQEMISMQTQVAQLSTQLETMQHDIQESIGAANQESMRASFSEYTHLSTSPPPQQIQQSQTEYSHSSTQPVDTIPSQSRNKHDAN
jgi:hypothetical protein